PYKGELPSTTDLLGGQLDSSFASIGTALPFLKAGRLRPLALVSTARSKVLPDVPTFGELGVPDVFEKRIRSDLAQWKKLLPEVGITPGD
ncbi:MAG: tripartite tricarboxylate transporter substrate binding protein, partial [Rubrivivax sp.]